MIIYKDTTYKQGYTFRQISVRLSAG